jgi:hypothetical protein
MLTASRDEYARFTRRVTLVSKGDSIRKLGTLALAAKTLHAYHTETEYWCNCVAAQVGCGTNAGKNAPLSQLDHVQT